MKYHVVDSNVLVAASTADPNTDYALTDHVPAAELEKVLEWVSGLRRDSERGIVLDEDWAIWKEYEDVLTEQSLGMLLLRDKIDRARWHMLEFDTNGHAMLGDELEAVVHDRKDRKFVAAALASEGEDPIANALDTDWYDWEKALEKHGIQVEQILDAWCRAQWRAKGDGA